MKTPITYENLRNYAYSNDKIVNKPIKGIVLEFTGLGGQEMLSEDTDFGKQMAENGIICIRPYYNPWSWMNRQTVKYVDELVDAVMEYYQLPENTPIISSGGSMGGLCALVYTHDAKRTPVRCVTNCPVCDLPYHFTERPDLPRTLYSAFGSYDDMTLEEAMRTASPVHLALTMPEIPYYIFHCDEDQAVNIKAHSEKFIQAMDGHEITFFVVNGRGHCDLTDEMREKYIECIIGQR